ncbi:peptidoglycan DD-metalloendopeptidase family protein [Geodermatophilus sp. SYSU D00696]
MSERHPDRLSDGGTPRDPAGRPSRQAAAASPSRRRAPAGKAQRTAPERRQGETSPAGKTTATRSARPRPTSRPRSGAAAGSTATGLEVRTVVVTGNTVVDDRVPAPADVVEEVLAAEPVTAVADTAELVEAADAQALAAVVVPREESGPETAGCETAEYEAAEPEDGRPAVAGGHTRRRTLRRLRPPRRRPAFYLAAALVGAVGLGTSATGDRAAQAVGTESVSSSVSVAQELGLDREESAAAAGAAELRSDAALLGELAASRTARETEEAAAAQAQAEAERVAAEAAAAAAAEAARPEAVLPVEGGRLTSSFGARWGKLHAGIDLAAPMLTPEYAAADGVVLEAGPASGYGNVVYIQHDNGDVTVYGHMEEILVQPGQVVRAGDTIALLGNRGQSTGPHLHFEVHVGGIDGQKIDPLPWLRERGVAI